MGSTIFQFSKKIKKVLVSHLISPDQLRYFSTCFITCVPLLIPISTGVELERLMPLQQHLLFPTGTPRLARD